MRANVSKSAYFCSLNPITMTEYTRGNRFTLLKHFFVGVFSSCLGFTIASLIVIAIVTANILSLLGSDKESNYIEPGSILQLQLSGVVVERSNPDNISSFLGESDPVVSLEETLNAISNAKTNPNIKGISIEAGPLLASPASLEELHKALLDFKTSRKFVYSYGNHYTQGVYFVCSAADKIVLNPIGQAEWKGLSAQTTFYTDLLAKLGIRMQVFKVGTFKSAVEPYTLTQMSEPNRKQVNAFLTDIWQNMLSLTSKSRKIPADTLNAIANRYTGLLPASELKKMHLVDELKYKDEYDEMLKKKLGLGKDDKLKSVSAAVASQGNDYSVSDNAIAILYAEGEIVDSKQMGILDNSCIDLQTMSKAIKAISDDDNIKAVVLRINSGGGSAFVSEQIWHLVKELNAKKPVVVSMGGMAASGAYYISAAASHIICEPTTLTGSIGIFGLIPDVSELLNKKLSLNFDVVKTNTMSDAGDMSRPFNERESQLMQQYIENGYKLFLKRVADGRKMTTAQVDSIAQGRVWTGRQALRIGLADGLGNLQDAIKTAAGKAKLTDGYTTINFPKQEPFLVSIGISAAEMRLAEKTLKSTLGELYEPLSALRAIHKQDRVQARIPYILKIE